MPHFGVIHGQFSSPENCMTWSRLWGYGYAANTDSRRELTQKYQQRRCFQDNQAISRRCFSTCFAAFHFCKNRSSKEFGDARSGQGHTPWRFKPRPPIGNRTNLPQPFTLAYALPHRSEKCLHICRALRLLGQRNPKDMNFTCFCFTVRWVHTSVVNWGAFSTYGRARDQMYMWIFGHIFTCLLSCLARNVNLWKIKFVGLTNCQ